MTTLEISAILSLLNSAKLKKYADVQISIQDGKIVKVWITEKMEFSGSFPA